jgi:hypothetical protein
MRREKMKRIALLAVALVMIGTAAMAGKHGELTLPDDWRKYEHIGSLVITDQTHDLYGIHHFYINDKGLKAFKKGEVYPDGTIIVDSVYKIEGSGGILNEGEIAFFPVMKKNSKMTETGGWEWGAFDPEGNSLGLDPQGCMACHEAAKDRDYVLSQPLFRHTQKK